MSSCFNPVPQPQILSFILSRFNNRYHLLDDIPFTTSVQFDMEIWHPFRKNMNYAAATFFYAQPGATCNIKPDVEAVRRKVALHRDEVVSLKETRLQ